MAQYNNPPAATATTHDAIAPASYTANTREKMDDYEIKVRKFLEQTKDDSDYEDKVSIICVFDLSLLSKIHGSYGDYRNIYFIWFYTGKKILRGDGEMEERERKGKETF
jgi:hypothetical protein